MAFVWLATLKDLRRLRRDPYSLVAWLAVPLLFAVMLSVFFRGGDIKPQGRLLIADEDSTLLSGVIGAAFSREPLNEMVLTEKVTREAGQRRMDHGDGSALLIIPAGFQKAYLRNEPFKLSLVTNPSQRILPQIIQETLSIAVEAGFYLQQVAGDQLRSFDSNTVPDEQAIARLSVEGSRVGNTLRRYLDPPLIALETKLTAEKPRPGFASLFFPSMLYMAIMFVANALALDIWKEQRLGTLRRLKATPSTLPLFLAGRVLYTAIVALIVSTGGVLTMYFMSGFPVSALPLAIAWTTLFTVAFQMILLLVAVHGSNMRGASVLSNIVIFPLAFLGGCFFPFEAMPAWMVRIGRFTPNGMAITQFRAIIDGSASVVSVAPFAAGLILMGLVVSPIVLYRMNNRFLA